MSYELYDQNGYLGPVASIEGWNDVLSALQGASSTVVLDFIEEGYTQEPQVLASQIDTFLQQGPLRSEVLPTLQNLVALLRKADEIAIVTG